MAPQALWRQERTRRLRGVQIGMFFSVLLVLLRYMPGPPQRLLQIFENACYDFYFEHRPPRELNDFVIIAIDEESLLPRHLGRFPWPRAVYVRILERLQEARVVGIDLLFAEPSADDKALAAAIRRHGRVVLAAHKRAIQRGAAQPSVWRGYGQAKSSGWPRAYVDERIEEEYVPPTPLLAQAAAGIGYVDIVPDFDGIYRRASLGELSLQGELMPHFGLELARLRLGLTPQQMAAAMTPEAIQIGEQTLPLKRGRLLINYAGPLGTVRYIPAWRVAAGLEPPETFRNKIVLIGPTAAGLYDVRPAPFWRHNRVFYGVELNANIAHTLLSKDTFHDHTTGIFAIVYTLLLGLLISLVIWHGEERLALWLSSALVLLLAAPTFWIGLIMYKQVLPYGAILGGTIAPWAVGLYERLIAEKRHVAAQFGTYVSPEVLRELQRHPHIVEQGQRRDVTLLFSDVRGSTSIAEKMPADVWIAQLNEYFTEMSEAVFAYNGYLDKFMGDGLMAVWNAFGQQPDHAELALKAAIQMLERLKRLNEAWAGREDRVPLRIGIGLHTGEAIVGNVGSARRAQYTAIGDSVNAAARIEALTKDYDAPLLLSETTAARVAPLVQLKEIGEITLRGRSQPLRIYTLQALQKTPETQYDAAEMEPPR